MNSVNKTTLRAIDNVAAAPVAAPAEKQSSILDIFAPKDPSQKKTSIFDIFSGPAVAPAPAPAPVVAPLPAIASAPVVAPVVAPSPIAPMPMPIQSAQPTTNYLGSLFSKKPSTQQSNQMNSIKSLEGLSISPVSSYRPPSSYKGTVSSTADSAFSGINWFMWILIIIFVLAFFGFNIFTFLASGTQTAADSTGKFLNNIGLQFGQTTQQVVDTSAKGAAAGLNFAVGATKGAIQGGVQAASQQQQPQQQQQQQSLEQSLNNSSTSSSQVFADSSSSTIQSSKAAGKSGWCYIGEDRGFRSCIKVGQNDTCMSGDIFPSQDICINPNLRS
jgi:hypothetical protein